MPAIHTLKCWFLIVLAGALCYLNALGNGFVFDDSAYLSSPLVRQFRPLDAFLQSTIHPDLYRPLTLLSLACDFRWYGDQPLGYHLSSLLLHLLNALLVFQLSSPHPRTAVRRALGRPVLRPPSAANRSGFLDFLPRRFADELFLFRGPTLPYPRTDAPRTDIGVVPIRLQHPVQGKRLCPTRRRLLLRRAICRASPSIPTLVHLHPRMARAPLGICPSPSLGPSLALERGRGGRTGLCQLPRRRRCGCSAVDAPGDPAALSSADRLSPSPFSGLLLRLHSLGADAARPLLHRWSLRRWHTPLPDLARLLASIGLSPRPSAGSPSCPLPTSWFWPPAAWPSATCIQSCPRWHSS